MAALISSVEIANEAFNRLGADTIASFTDSEDARMAETMYGHLVALLLEKFEWSFSKAYKVLTVTTVEHPFFDYVYAVPTDCAIPRQVMREDTKPRGRIDWELFQTYLATSEEDAWLRYSLNNVTDVTKWPNHFKEVVITGLMANMATKILQSASKRRELMGEARVILNEALLVEAYLDSENPNPNQDPDNDLFIRPGLEVYGSV